MGEVKDGQYHKWFAWRPVTCDCGSIRWLTFVNRRTFSFWAGTWKTHYKKLGDFLPEHTAAEFLRSQGCNLAYEYAVEWMDIDTAPRDGSKFVAWSTECNDWVSCFWDIDKGYFASLEYLTESFITMDIKATHWAPPPTPPHSTTS